MVPMWLLCCVSEDPPALHFQEQASAVVHITCSFCQCIPMDVGCQVVLGE